jgi:hypothetical protein
MAVTDRLRELRGAGKHELVETLASEVLRKEEPRITLSEDVARVETRTFVGEHAVDGSVDRSDRRAVEAAVERRGTYRLADPDESMADFSFASGGHHDAVVDRVASPSEDAEGGSERAGDGPDGNGSADSEELSGAVDPSPDREPSARDDAAEAGGRTSSSFLQQAVVAVQNTLR